MSCNRHTNSMRNCKTLATVPLADLSPSRSSWLWSGNVLINSVSGCLLGEHHTPLKKYFCATAAPVKTPTQCNYIIKVIQPNRPHVAKQHWVRRNGIQFCWKNSSPVASSPFVSPEAAPVSLLWPQWAPHSMKAGGTSRPAACPSFQVCIFKIVCPKKYLPSPPETKSELESDQQRLPVLFCWRATYGYRSSISQNAPLIHITIPAASRLTYAMKSTHDRRWFLSQDSSVLTVLILTCFDSPLPTYLCSHPFCPLPQHFLKLTPNQKFTSHYISCSSVPLSPPPTTPYVPHLFPTEQSLVSGTWQLKWPPLLSPQKSLPAAGVSVLLRKQLYNCEHR